MRHVKALLPHPDGSGRTLVRAAAETLLAAGLSPLIVVLGHARREIAPELQGLAVRAVPNPAYQRGMLSSLQAGIRALAAERHIFWAVVAPLDQPFLSAGLVQRLVATAAGPRHPPAAVVPATPAMERTGTWGLPVVLRRRLFPEVLELSGTRAVEGEGRDRGAGRVLALDRPERGRGGEHHLDVVLGDDAGSGVQLSCDGQTTLELAAGDRISIAKHRPALRLIHPVGHEYYATLRAKLHWGKGL